MLRTTPARDQSHVHRIKSELDLSVALAQLRKWSMVNGFDAPGATRLVTAASEIGRNILKYAGKGELRYRPVAEGRKTGVEVAAVDQGPGIADIELAMQDRFSSSGTLGLGLPGVKRLVDRFDINSSPESGTHVTFRLWKR
jgi:serine/threonine-protein kinase RsbT